MKIYLLKKKQQRKYNSDDLLDKILALEGLEGFKVERYKNGKPYLTLSSCPSSLHVSVSHTLNFWVCILAEDVDVGIDIEERNRSVSSSIVKKLHPLEQNYLSIFREGSRDWSEEFLTIWTRKESYVKFIGSGLAEGLSNFSVITEKSEYAVEMQDKNKTMLFISGVFLNSSLIASVCSSQKFKEPTIIEFYDEGSPLKTALEQAADFLAVRDYSSGSLIKKLKEKGHSTENAMHAVRELTERGYLDDVAFSINFIQKAMEAGKGKRRIERELVEKGIDCLAAKDLLAQMAEQIVQSETERALFQAQKILDTFYLEQEQEGSPTLTDKQLGKVARRLSSLGYESSTIYEIIGRLRR